MFIKVKLKISDGKQILINIDCDCFDDITES